MDGEGSGRPDLGAGRSRLVEVLAAFSAAADVGYGQPMGDGLRVCLLAVRLAQELGLAETERRRVLDLALVRHIGCVANADEVAAIVGDEVALREPTARMDFARPAAMLPHMLRHVARTQPPASRLAAFVRLASGVGGILATFPAVCEIAEMLGPELGIDAAVIEDVALYEERWDGKGIPGSRRGPDLPIAVQIVQVAEAAESFQRVAGTEVAVRELRDRAGSVLAPDPARLLGRLAERLFDELEQAALWEEVVGLEPLPWRWLDEAAMERALEAFGDFADLRSRWLSGHSRGVAALAADAGERAGLPRDDVVLLRHAGLVHDIGRAGISAGVWGAPRQPTSAQWEQVRLHAYYTDRILARPAALAALGRVASLDHERLDGSGYFRGLRGEALSPVARILAAADVCRALSEARPHRAALVPDRVEAVLRQQVLAGRLDGDAVAVTLEAADGRPRRRREGPAGLTPRELEVLGLLARGNTKQQVASQLVLSRKTVDAHAQAIYAKLGVSSRAAMTLVAIRHGLLEPSS